MKKERDIKFPPFEYSRKLGWGLCCWLQEGGPSWERFASPGCTPDRNTVCCTRCWGLRARQEDAQHARKHFAEPA